MISKAAAHSTMLFWLLLVLAVHSSRAENEVDRIDCDKSAYFGAPNDLSTQRKYAPDRRVQILHLALDVTPDFKSRTVSGQATFTFKPIAKPLDSLELDAVDLAVTAVDASAKVQGYQLTGQKVQISFEEAVPVDRETRLTITYNAEPVKGLYFRTPEMGYKQGDTHLFTQGEAIEARHWYPCYDSPNAKFTSEITCHVPQGMTVLSNGRLMSEAPDARAGLIAVRWLQDKPHANYLISLVAGYLKKVEDRYNDIPLAFYTPASEINEAATSFGGTKDMMGFFEKEIGVPYPWAKYYQVCVNDFVAGGMENTSITTLTDSTLFTPATENIESSQGLVAHELAHQWFGDLVTCKDWSHLWLNEGFATFYALLYDESKNGHDSMLYGFYEDARGFLERPNDTTPIVYRRYDSPDEQFSYLAYPKGSWVLRMLRSQLGEELYRRCIKTYLERHQYGNVTTEDLNQVVEQLSARSYDRFFDQWVYHAHHPELEVSYSWNQKENLAKLTIKQNQKLSEEVLLFDFPLKVRFKSKGGSVDREITVKEKEEDFYFPLTSTPEIVRVDPDYTLLAKTTFNLPTAMLYAQLADTSDVIGRLLAVDQLSKKTDLETVAKLKERLKTDPFYGVRIEAAKALRSIHSDEAFTALLESLDQSDARARRQVVSAVVGFYSEQAYATARRVTTQERNPAILSRAIDSLGGYGKTEVGDSLVSYLDSQSYRNSLVDAAIGAIRAQDNPAYIAPLRRCLEQREAQLTSRTFASGLSAMAYSARHEDNKTEVREFLLRFVNHKKRTVQLAAIGALGTLEDPRAIPVLETFASSSKGSPVRDRAERSLSQVRGAKKSGEELKDLREEVLGLQKKEREMRKELDDLKKKVGAQSDQPVDAKSKKNPLPPKASHR